VKLESILLFVSDLDVAKSFYVGLLGLPTIFEDALFGLRPRSWAGVERVEDLVADGGFQNQRRNVASGELLDAFGSHGSG
jgi:catechol 2,3-dioxygenase-like lactoylglutathione lyase family enzyme